MTATPQNILIFYQQQAQEQERIVNSQEVTYDDDDDDDDDDSTTEPEAVVFSSFIEQGPSSLVVMTNFTPFEYEQLWTDVQHSFYDHKPRGKPAKFSPKDSFFLLLAYLKSYDKLD